MDQMDQNSWSEASYKFNVFFIKSPIQRHIPLPYIIRQNPIFIKPNPLHIYNISIAASTLKMNIPSGNLTLSYGKWTIEIDYLL